MGLAKGLEGLGTGVERVSWGEVNGGLALKSGSFRHHVTIEAMRLEASFARDATHQVLADAELAGELAVGPLCGADGGIATGGRGRGW